MPQAQGFVAGSHAEHEVKFYGLSTCIWCRKTRMFLEEKDVQFRYTYLDLLHGQELEEAKEKVRAWNPAVSFPTIVIDGTRCVVGYRPEQLAEALGL